MNRQEIINRVFGKLQDPISDYNQDVFPYSVIPALIKEALDWLSCTQTWHWAQEVASLKYINGVREYNLDEYGITPTRIKNVYFFEGNNVTYLYRVDKEVMRRDYHFDKTGKPTQFAIRNNKLILDFCPDKDYEIKVEHYREIPMPVTSVEDIEVIPENNQKVVSDYLAFCLAFLLEKSNAEVLFEEFKTAVGRLKKDNQDFFGVPTVKQSSINWNR